MGNGFDFKDYSTVEEFINSKDDLKYSYYSMSILEKVGDVEYPVNNITYDYLNEIKSLAVKVTLTDAEMARYMYRPDLLAYDLYRNTQLDFIILAINELASPKDFIYKTVYLLYRSDLVSVLNEIYGAEQDYLTYNHSKIQE